MVLALLKPKEVFLKVEFQILVMGFSILLGNNPNQYFSDYVQTLFMAFKTLCMCVPSYLYII